MKKLALYGAIGYGIYYLFNKGQKALQAFRNISTEVVDFRDIKPGLSQFTLYIDVRINNPTQIPINISTMGLARVKRINLFNDKGVAIGYAETNMESLNIPAGGWQRLNNIHTIIYSNYIINLLGNMSGIKNIATTIEIEVAGKTITV